MKTGTAIALAIGVPVTIGVIAWAALANKIVDKVVDDPFLPPLSPPNPPKIPTPAPKNPTSTIETFPSPYYQSITLKKGTGPKPWVVSVMNAPAKADGQLPTVLTRTAFASQAKARDFAVNTQWEDGRPSVHGIENASDDDILVRVASGGTGRHGSVWQNTSEGWFYTISMTPTGIYVTEKIPGEDAAIAQMTGDIQR